MMEVGSIFVIVWCFMFILSIAGFVFMIWALIDCVKNEPDEGNDKLIWILVILLLGWIGALVYYFVRVNNRY